jgi:hypothetical protein
MRRNKTFKRGRVIPLLVAGGLGYLAAGWSVTALRSTNDLSAAGVVALRFPEDWNHASPMTREAVADAMTGSEAGSMTDAASNLTPDAQTALLNPVPMLPQANQTARQDAPPQQAAPPLDQRAPLQIASVDGALSAASQAGTAAPQRLFPSPRASSPIAHEARPVAAATRHPVINRPGFMLDDAQIASIKERLHLTPDQERMWPAVASALRNMAYAHAQQTRGRSVAPSEQAAAVDPDSVQGLKSAAVPLIMSFNAEQKEEVRNLAHVMGLDQLASQF